MKKNRTLLIVLLAGVAVLLIFVVGLAFFYPRQTADALEIAGVEPNSARSFDPIEYLRGEQTPLPDLLPAIDSDADGSSGRDGDLSSDLVIVYGDNEREDTGSNLDIVPAIGIDAQRDVQRAAQQVIDRAPQFVAPTTRLRIADRPERVESSRSQSLSQSAQPAQPQEDGQLRPLARTEPRPSSQEPRQVPASPLGHTADRPTASSQTTSNQTTSSKTTSSQAAKASPVSYRAGSRYWIQLISSTDRDRVEQLRASISSYHIDARLETSEQDDRLYYRLRYGPFASREEAQKFLDWMDAIGRFDDSYVTN